MPIAHQLILLGLTDKDSSKKFLAIAKNAKLPLEDLLTQYTHYEKEQIYADLKAIWNDLTKDCHKAKQPAYLGTVGINPAQIKLLEQSLGFELAKDTLPTNAVLISRTHIMPRLKMFKTQSAADPQARIERTQNAAIFIERAMLVLAMLNNFNIAHEAALTGSREECYATLSTLVQNGYYSAALKLLFVTGNTDLSQASLAGDNTATGIKPFDHVVERMCDSYFGLAIADLYWTHDSEDGPTFVHFAEYNGGSNNNICSIPEAHSEYAAFKALISQLKPAIQRKVATWVNDWESNPLRRIQSKPNSPNTSPRSSSLHPLPDLVIETQKRELGSHDTASSVDISPGTGTPHLAGSSAVKPRNAPAN